MPRFQVYLGSSIGASQLASLRLAPPHAVNPRSVQAVNPLSSPRDHWRHPLRNVGVMGHILRILL